MTAFNRKSKVTKKRTDSGADYDYKESTPTRNNELQLFDNEDNEQQSSSNPSIPSQP